MANAGAEPADGATTTTTSPAALPVLVEDSLSAATREPSAASAEPKRAEGPSKGEGKEEEESSGSRSPKQQQQQQDRPQRASSPPATKTAATPQTPARCSGHKIRLGICAMDKKARSKPMAEILSRLDEELFCVVFFGDDCVLNRPVEEWPDCDVLVAFFSKGFPLSKAREYVALRKPFVLNNLDMQETLLDRRKVYDLLEKLGIDTARHVFLSRDGYVSTGTGDGNGANDQQVKEFDDHIEVNGVEIHKPFVEKPVNAEDHAIAIYYPTSK